MVAGLTMQGFEQGTSRHGSGVPSIDRRKPVARAHPSHGRNPVATDQPADPIAVWGVDDGKADRVQLVRAGWHDLLPSR